MLRFAKVCNQSSKISFWTQTFLIKCSLTLQQLLTHLNLFYCFNRIAGKNICHEKAIALLEYLQTTPELWIPSIYYDVANLNEYSRLLCLFSRARYFEGHGVFSSSIPCFPLQSVAVNPAQGRGKPSPASHRPSCGMRLVRLVLEVLSSRSSQ